jgi:hypothetical protein
MVLKRKALGAPLAATRTLRRARVDLPASKSTRVKRASAGDDRPAPRGSRVAMIARRKAKARER